MRRHEAVKGALADWCEEQGCTVEKEVVMPLASPDAEESRMDLMVRVPGLARKVHVDVTVADATSREALSRNAASRDGAAAQILEQRKRRKYPNVLVVPFAVEAHGRLGESAVRLLKLIAPKPLVERAEAISRMYQSCAAFLQKTQADAIISASRSRPPMPAMPSARGT